MPKPNPSGDNTDPGQEPDPEATDATTDDASDPIDSTDDEATGADDEDPADGDSKNDWDPERARRHIAKLIKENTKLNKRVKDAPKPEDVAAKDQRINELEPENLRLRVGYEIGLPIDLVDRLKGSTREEMIEDAERLLELVAPASTKRPASRTPTETPRGGSDPGQEPEETDLAKIGARIYQR